MLLQQNNSIASEKSTRQLRVCVPLPSFPVMGGILTVLEGIAQVTEESWQLEYLTQYVGPDAERFPIQRFSSAKMGPWHFPLIWFYAMAGFLKLYSLLRHGSRYQLILPQDGVYSGAFAALVGKLFGVRVICIDHSTMTLLDPEIYRVYRAERIAALTKKRWHWSLHLLARLLFSLYQPSLYLLARICASSADHYLIPGVVGDGVEEICKRLGIPKSRLTRFASMIDLERHPQLDAATRASQRKSKGLDEQSIVIAITCRLSPEKGLHIALESIDQFLTTLSPDQRACVRIVIAGDGPLRKDIEGEIERRGLSQTCILWGELAPTEVHALLAISDIFLYTSTRGACFAMAVLEAMASGCTVVASTRPISNVQLLAEGRGIAVAPNDVAQTAQALALLVNDLKACHHMGQQARAYIAQNHSPAQFEQVLLQVTSVAAGRAE